MSILKISNDLVIQRIKYQNAWWRTSEIASEIKAMKPRLYFNLFKKRVYQKDVIRAQVLMGPRRVGKTIMLYHLIQDLINEGIDPHKICYVSIDNPVFRHISLEEILWLALQSVSDDKPEGWYIIFDEIQYLPEWEIHLKSLVDTYRKTHFIASGSAAAALKLKSVESGAGRFSDFTLPPLTFQEFLYLRDKEQLIKIVYDEKTGLPKYETIDINALNLEFIDYINFGGYPEVIFSDEIKENAGQYIQNDIIDKVLLRDLPSLYGIPSPQQLNDLFTMIAYNTGNHFSSEELSQQSGGIKKDTINKYIEYLEAAFLIKKVKRVDNNSKKFQREREFKLYLTNPSLRAALFAPVSPTDDSTLGSLVETAIYAQWMHWPSFYIYYARWNKGEIDAIGINEITQKPKWAVEIKWSDNIYKQLKETDEIINYCKQNNLKRITITTKTIKETKIYGDIEVDFIPCAIFAYAIAANTILLKGWENNKV